MKIINLLRIELDGIHKGIEELKSAHNEAEEEKCKVCGKPIHDPNCVCCEEHHIEKQTPKFDKECEHKATNNKPFSLGVDITPGYETVDVSCTPSSKVCNKCGGYKPDNGEIFGCSKVCNCPQPSSVEECEHKFEWSFCTKCGEPETNPTLTTPSKPRIEGELLEFRKWVAVQQHKHKGYEAKCYYDAEYVIEEYLSQPLTK